nr:uncharacterized mitochondrial protein AtMg00810-like [Tanacetum cinerariifolium]
CQIVQKKHEEKRIEEEQAAKAQNQKLPVCYDDDGDEEESNSLKDNIISELPPCSAITPTEPVDSLSMGDEHLDTILATESEEFIKSCVENLVPNPRIDKTDCHPENEIHLSQRLLYDNSFPRPPEEFKSENSNAEIESFSPSPIPNEDTSRPDVMFAVCAYARFQVTPKVSHLYAVKRIFRYMKGQPKLGIWYPSDSLFDLESFSKSDYAGASLDRKSTTGGCQFLGKRLISWQGKKKRVVANSTTEAEYVANANYCGQLLWI